MIDHLLHLFPGLRPAAFRVTSPRDRTYNCTAWAAGFTNDWWWPIDVHRRSYWPPGVAREETLEAFRDAFATLDYALCSCEILEAGVEKVALFADYQNVPTHAARQLPNGRWTSKLGIIEDIEHDLRDLEGDIYGTVVLLLKRSLQPPKTPRAPDAA